MSNGNSNSFDLNVDRVIPGGSWVLVDRAIRGGSWVFDGACCRAADRDVLWPNLRSRHFGLRLALRETERVRDNGEKKERE